MDKTKKGGKIALISLITLMVAVIALLTVLLLTKNNDSDTKVIETPSVADDNANGHAYVVDENNINQINAEMSEKVQDGMFATHMNMAWTFPDGKSPSTDAVIGNAESNTKPTYFEIALETGQIIYTSSILPVGSSLKSLTLDEPLKKGTYKAYCIYHLMNEKDGKYTESSTVSFEISLTIEA